MFYKKDALKKFVKITGKYLCCRLFVKNVSGLLQYIYFPVNLAKFLRTFFIEDRQWLLLSNASKLKEKKKKHAQFENKAKYQLETTLIIPNIKERKNVNMIGKDLVF